MTEPEKTLTLREQTLEFLGDLAWATKGIPGEAVKWWHDCHRWDRPTHYLVERKTVLPSGGVGVTVYEVEDPDHRLWVQLGYATDALLLVIALAIVFLFVAAVL